MTKAELQKTLHRLRDGCPVEALDVVEWLVAEARWHAGNWHAAVARYQWEREERDIDWLRGELRRLRARVDALEARA